MIGGDGGQNLVPATAAPETPDAIESEIEGTKQDFIRGIERQRLLLLTILSGGLCGLAAVCFHVGIGKAENLVINRVLAAPFPAWIYLAILIGGRAG